MSSIDYSEAIKSKKGVISSERIDCGNIIGERGDSILVEREGVREHVYVIPKSKVEAFDGAQIILNVGEAQLKSFEERRDNGGSGDTASSTTDSIKQTTGQVKDTITDTISGTVGKVKDFVTGDNNK
ncbi:MAG: hypothetical protein ACTHJ7_07270 [Candidatus Nitrosocosmicus sp.]